MIDMKFLCFFRFADNFPLSDENSFMCVIRTDNRNKTNTVLQVFM
jgi:hypothetical protein